MESMMGLFSRVIAGFLLLCVAGEASGQGLTESYETPRALGMGNAFTAIAMDQTSVWTNPAGVGRIRKAHARFKFSLLSFPNAVVAMNAVGRGFFERLQAVGTQDTAKIFAGMSVNNKPIWARVASNPIILFDAPKGVPWAFGPFFNSRASAVVDTSSSTPEVVLSSVFDYGAVLAFGFATFANRFNIGFTVRPITRYDYYDRIDPKLLFNYGFLQERSKKGSNVLQGVGADFGVMWTLTDFWFPTFAFAIRNLPTGCAQNYLNPFAEERQTVCGTKFSGTITNSQSPNLIDPMDARVGFSMLPRLSQKIGIRFALDVQHMYFGSGKTYYGLSGIQPIDLLHSGAELFIGNPLLANPLAFRVGYSQGFSTMGASLKMSFLALDFATYGQNVSTTVSPSEDRRYIFGLSAEL